MNLSVYVVDPLDYPSHITPENVFLFVIIWGEVASIAQLTRELFSWGLLASQIFALPYITGSPEGMAEWAERPTPYLEDCRIRTIDLLCFVFFVIVLRPSNI